jgi:hypothetical protein
MQQLAFHLGHEIAGGAVAECRIKANGSLAKAFISRADQVIDGHRPAASKTVRLLMR